MVDFKPIREISSEKESFVQQEEISYWKESFRRLMQDKSTKIALWILLILIFFACIGPLISTHSYYDIHLPLKNRPPSWDFWFGTDELGRDMFCRIWWGARISLFVGFSASLIDLVIGVVFGAISAFLGGKIDEALMRFTDILASIPYLLVVILLTVFVGPGLLSILLALTFTGWIPMARITRGQILQLKELDYAKAAEALGASSLRVLFRHLLPNALGPIIMTLTFTIPTAIFAEAFLSFLGLGIQAPIASWGTMANDGLPALDYYPWRLFLPAFFISITMLCFNLLGDKMRDAFDPRLRV